MKKKYKINLTELISGAIPDPLYVRHNTKWNEDFKMDVSNYLLNKISRNNYEIGREFSSPFGCQALEGTTLVIDGISLNGKPLPPIEIKLSYKK